MTSKSIEILDIGRRAKAASRILASASASEKITALQGIASSMQLHTASILEANAIDLEVGRANGVEPLVLDRLMLDESRIETMADGVRKVAELHDPIGDVISGWRRPNGLEISQVRVPLGVVAIIYENRPNVTSDAAALCIKSSNACILRGSSGAINSNIAISQIFRDALANSGLPSDAVILIDDTSYETAKEVMTLPQIDCLIPRGGRALVQSIKENATCPVIIDGDGNCTVYVDAFADVDEAVSIIMNSKVARPSVCNAAESLVIHADIAEQLLACAIPEFVRHQVTLVGDERCVAISDTIGAATDEDFYTEYLDLKMSVKIVDDISEAISWINEHSSGHTEAIVTNDLDNAMRFSNEVDAAVVNVNASTRWTDGEMFGFGAEIGISTQKLHARGPMGLTALTSTKYKVFGTGQLRT